MSFFEKKEVSIKCENCLIKKKNVIEYKNKSHFIKKVGSGDILFILEMPEFDKVLFKFEKFLKNNAINSYQIITGLKCKTKDYLIPSPMYKCYKTCDCLQKDFDCKVIVPIGRALFAVTQSDDLVSWRDFAEFNFNQTYFYTPFDWNKKIRVYPIPSLIDWIHNQDNFEKFFTLYQLNQVKDYLKNYKKENFSDYEIEEVEDVNKFLEDNIDKQEISWDLETKHLKHFANDFFIICMTVSFDGIKGYYLPFEKINKRLLYRFLKDKVNIGAVLKFDCKALHVEGVQGIEVSEDIVLLHHLLNTQRINNSEKSLAWLIGFGGYDKELDEYKEKMKIKTYDQIPKKILFPYATLDPVIAFRLYKFGLGLAKKQPKVYECYKEYVIPSIPAFMEMEINGIHVNTDYINKLDNELKGKCEQIENLICEEFKEKFDLSSNQQLATILEKNKWPCLGRSKKQFYINESGEKVGYYSVDKSVLEQWKNSGYELAEKILDYRSTAKLRDAFLGNIKEENEGFFTSKDDKKNEKEKGLIKFLQSDGLLHPTYNPGRTDSGRSSCTAPNIQQLPKQGEEGKIFRPSIACPDDYYIVEVDYSGFQLRIAAIYSEDSLMLDIFKNNGDMHSITAQSILCRDVTLDYFLEHKKEEPYKTYRYKSKGINFGFLFGLSAFSFKSTIENEWIKEEINKYIKDNKLKIKAVGAYLDKSLTVAESIRTMFFNTYKKLLPWIENQHIFGEKNGYVDSWHGLRRHLPELKHVGKDIDPWLLSNLKNISVNSPVQALESIVVYNGMKKVKNVLNKYNMKTKFLTMIHDSLAFYCHKNEVKDLYYITKENMEDHVTWDIPITIDFAVGKVLGFGEEINNDGDLKFFCEKENI